MSGHDRQQTMPRLDDGRRQTGHRVMVPKGDLERLTLAQAVASRLSPERVHQLRLLAAEMLLEDAMLAPADPTEGGE
jgi:hypothetical protein